MIAAETTRFAPEIRLFLAVALCSALVAHGNEPGGADSAPHPAHQADHSGDEGRVGGVAHEGHATNAAHAVEGDAAHEGHGDHGETGHAVHTADATGHDPLHDHADDGSAHPDQETVQFPPEHLRRFGIVVRPARPGSLQDEVRLQGEVVFNEDRVVHMAPRVGGVVHSVHKTMGDRVTAGEVLAVIESRELADAKAEYLAAEARAALAETTFERETALQERQVSSRQDYLEAEAALVEARIQRRAARQKLLALGLAGNAVDALADDQDEAITRYPLVSPIDGVVIRRHISLGESLEANADVFTIADLDSVWVNLAVHTRDLLYVRRGQNVLLQTAHGGDRVPAELAMVTPFVEEATRSATARAVLDNHDGRWIPGTFVTGIVRTTSDDLPVVVPRDAVQQVDGRDVVFVRHEDAFRITPVRVGRSDRATVEISDGLEPHTPYVAEGAFHLKATVITRDLGSHAGHGH